MKMNEHVKFIFAFSLFLLVAGFFIHLPSELGSSLAIPPDSNEYSICLANLFEHGKFGFTLNGEWYPSRYAPWFSLLCLTPAYLLFWGDILSLHWAVLAFALLFLVMSYKFARLAGLEKWSFVCAVIPLFIPDFVYYSRLVMTEIPYAAILALSAIAFVRLANAKSPSLKFCFGAGALVAWAGAVRASGLPMLGLFAVVLLFKKTGLWRKVVSALVLSIPAIAYEAANLIYNKCVFGSPFRSGYHFWVSVPCDYPDMTFNFEYALSNVSEYLHEPITLVALALSVVIAVVALLMLRGRFGGVDTNKGFLWLSSYVLLQGFVLFSLYIGYYWCDVRFFLPFMLCEIPLFLRAAVVIVGEGKVRKTIFMSVSLAVCAGGFRLVAPRYYFISNHYPIRIAEAAVSREVLPSGAVVVQDGNPAFMDCMGQRGKRLEFLPVYRRFDYVNAMVAPFSISEFGPKPESWHQRIVPELVSNGVCKLPFPVTLTEDHTVIDRYLESGRRVFLHYGIFFNPNVNGTNAALSLLDRFDMKLFGTWTVPAIEPNPVRHIYDRFLLWNCSMDSRLEVQCIYYEILPKSAGSN